MSGIFTILHFVAYYVVARSVLCTKKSWNVLLGLFLATSVVMGSLGIYEHAYGAFVNAAGGRVWATLGNSIYLGVYMLFAVFVSAYLLTETKSWWYRAPLVAVGLLDLYVLFLSESRASLLAIGLSVLVIPLVTALRAKGKVRKLAMVGVVLLVLAGAGLFLGRDTAFVKDIPGVRRLVETSLTGGGDRTRIIAWEIALDAWKDKWLFGWGPENFYAAFNVFYRPESLMFSYYETWFDRAHNSVLDMLAMTGLVGTIFSLGIYVVAAYTALRRIKTGGLTVVQGSLFVLFLGAYFLQNLFAFDALSGFLLFYLLLAFLDAEPQIQGPAPDASRKLPTAAAVLVVAPVAFLMLWLVFLNVRMWQGNVLNLAAIADIRYGRLAEAGALHAKALALGSPHASEFRADFAREASQLIGRVQPGTEKDAMALIQTSVADLRANVAEGKDVFDSIMLAQVLMTSEDPALLAEAERTLTNAITFSPHRQQLLYTLSRDYILERRYDDAIKLMKQVIAEEPRVGESHWVLTLAYYQAQRGEDAWKSVQDAMKNRYVWRDASERDLMLELGMKFGPPTDPIVLATYAESEAAAGATSSAFADMKKASATDPTLKIRADALFKSLEGQPNP
jgi:O-antigen ligase